MGGFAELNYIIDRNTYVANMMAGELADQLPTTVNGELDVVIPHTRASFKIHVSFHLSLDHQNSQKIF